ncbi:MAG: hypothetical protein ACI3Z0_10900 [Candidatus Cryptobacteroides sp.]
MKKLKLIVIALCAIVVSGCQKELTSTRVREGLPASLDIIIDLGKSESLQMTRSIYGYESQINELMLIMFEESNGRKMVIDLTGNLAEGTADGTYGGHRTYTLANAVTTDIDGNDLLSGTYRVYSVANWSSPFCGLSRNGLAEMSENELKSAVAANAKAAIRVTGDEKFPMTGYAEGQTIQPAEDGGSSIAVSLKRLIAHIEFSFVNDTSPENAENPIFTPYSFSVYNIPTSSFLMSQGSNEGDNMYECENFGYVENIEINGASGIEFFMLENVQNKPDNWPTSMTAAQQYALRDSWTGETSEGETLPIDKNWVYAPETSTFVVVSGEYEGTSYTGRVSYTIHLGNFSGTSFGNSASGYDNFIVNRNEYQRYTVTIKGVNNIVAEAKLEEGDGVQPGAEGTITTISKTAQFVLDAHFETGILSFTIPADGLSMPTIIVKTPYNLMTRYNLKDDLSLVDYRWVTFTKPSGANILASYPGTGSASLTDIVGLGIALANPSSSSPYYMLTGPVDGMYTVYTQAFVNEYYYDNRPDGTAASWPEFVNNDNRMLIFNPDVETSPDGNSVNFPTYLFQISQRSIKTTYATTDASMNAFGIETWNETGKIAVDNVNALDADNGWENSKTLLGSYNSWPNFGYTSSISDNSKESHVFYSSGDGVTLGSGYYACLTRNRDENGDGTIDEAELKWYIPAVNQFFSLWMGQDYLQGDTQLFDPSLISSLTSADMTKYNLLMSSGDNNTEYWAIEGASVGGNSNLKGVRCVRNLSVFNGVPAGNSTLSGNVITVTGASAVRTTKMTGEYASGHSERDADNILPAAFEVASADLSGIYTIAQVRDNSLCAEYSQDDNAEDQGQWRIPNQRELMLIKQWGILGNSNNSYASRTFFSARNNSGVNKIEPYAYHPYSGRFTLEIGNSASTSDSQGAYTIRCVRDANPVTLSSSYDGYLTGGDEIL